MTLIDLDDTVMRECKECGSTIDVPRGLAEQVPFFSGFICTDCDETPDFCYDCGNSYTGTVHMCGRDSGT